MELLRTGSGDFAAMTIDRDIWPEFVYRYVEHYRWEPQHLGPDTAAFYRKIRSQEVPLNFLFNILLYALPSPTIRSLFSRTGAVAAEGASLTVRNSPDQSFTQPDVQLESSEDRIFVELKVKAKTRTEQAQKYALLHAKLALDDPRPKRPSLIYITQHAIARHWSPKREAPLNGGALIAVLAEAPLSEKLARNRQVRSLEKHYRMLCPKLRVGFLTWQQLGDELNKHSGRDGGVSHAFIRGFLADLARRGLWEA
ncbi:MAG: hypothetical protein D6815_09485 [Candidatus Dadabacteria bacterium]|nr:MAG: hypothetical protein D6815_09485 [Candidatus Dadabacteria bacterium]